MDKLSSRGASIRVTRSSKYSLAPLNVIVLRSGRIERVIGGGRWLSLSGRDREDENPRERVSRLVNRERHVAIASGEMYPEGGMPESSSRTRQVADKSNFGNPENKVQSNVKDRRRGADPPRNESGMTGSVSSSGKSRRSVNSGNGTCITARNSSNCQPEKYERKTSDTRLLCPSAAMTLSMPDNKAILPLTTRGKAGQTSSVSLMGVSGVQRSWRLRRRGDPKTRHRHRLHTCTSDCHASMSFFLCDILTT